MAAEVRKVRWEVGITAIKLYTPNTSFKSVKTIFSTGQDTLADAGLDRIVYDSYTIEIYNEENEFSNERDLRN